MMPTHILRKIVRKYTAAGAIDVNATHVELASAGGAAMTLAAPPASPNWEGHQMTIQCTTAQSHTVVYSAGFNGAGAGSDTLTLDAVNEAAIIEARGGVWFIVSIQGGGLS